MTSTFLLLAAVAVLKVEPPNWWAQHSINPVRLLIRGTELAGARIEPSDRWLQTGNVRVNSRGTYAFVDVVIRRDTPPGPHPLRLSTPSGTAEVPFEITPALPRTGRFQGFGADDVLYLIMPDRFANGDPANDDPPPSKGMFDPAKPRYYHGGDLQGITDRLPYLRELGVTAIWLTPVYDNVNRLSSGRGQPFTDYHGYGAVDLYAVDEHLGTIAKFRDMVDAAHRAGIRIIQDQVANHTGPQHPWVQDPPTPTWYNGTAERHLANAWQTWTLADPYATPAMRAATLDGWFLNILPDLNQRDPDVARYIIQNTLWWIGMTGLDGIRQDTLPYVPRTFWAEWMAAIKREYPRFTVVGEFFDEDPSLVSFFQGGRARFDGIDSGIDALFDFPLYFALRRAFIEGKSVRDLAKMLSRDHLYVNPTLLVTFLGLHDVARFMNEKGATVEGLKLAWTFLMTTRGIPMIYYGDEIAMAGGDDPDNRRDFPVPAFAASGRTAEQQSVWEHVRRLARLRAETPALRTGPLRHLYADDHVYVYARGAVVVAINNAAKPAEVEAGDVPREDTLGVCADTQGGRIRLPPHSGCVFAQ